MTSKHQQRRFDVVREVVLGYSGTSIDRMIQQFLKPKLVQQVDPTFYQCWSNNKSLWDWLDPKIMLRLWIIRPCDVATMTLKFCWPCLSPWNRGEPEDGDKYRIDNGSHVLESWSVKISHVRDWLLRKSWSNIFPSPTKLDQLCLLVQQKVGRTIVNLDPPLPYQIEAHICTRFTTTLDSHLL